jgi:hypothetical protein
MEPKPTPKKKLEIKRVVVRRLADAEFALLSGADTMCPGGTGPCPTNGPPG